LCRQIGVIDRGDSLSAAPVLLLIRGIPASVVFLYAILHIVSLRDVGRLVGPSDNGSGVDNRWRPLRTVLIGDLGAELGGDARIIDADFLLDNAVVPDGMKVELAWSRDGDQVSAAVIIERDVLRLMDVANPMPKAFEKPELVAYVEAKGEIPRVV